MLCKKLRIEYEIINAHNYIRAYLVFVGNNLICNLHAERRLNFYS